MDVSFEVTSTEALLIDKIVQRARKTIRREGERFRKGWALNLKMDVTATHANGCRLDLPKLLDAEEFTFLHDVCGISNTIDRETGKLTRHFLPRCRQRSPDNG